MSFKTAIIVIVVTASISWLVFSVISNKDKKELDQSTASHHGTTTVSASIFNSLVGKEAPGFALESYDGKKISLNNLKGKNVVLFFSEGLMCYPACWNQIAAFGKDKSFNNESTIVLTIVNDKKDDWKQAVDKMSELVQATVLFDTDLSVSKTYGVLSLPSSMHKEQLAGHSYVLVDKDGIIRFARDDEQMAVRNKELATEIDKLN